MSGTEGGAAPPAGANADMAEADASDADMAEAPEPEPLAWLPDTLAAVALRLQAVDASLLYGSQAQPAARETLPGYQFIQRPTADGVVSGQPLGERCCMLCSVGLGRERDKQRAVMGRLQ